jgi:hypothetical protein
MRVIEPATIVELMKYLQKFNSSKRYLYVSKVNFLGEKVGGICIISLLVLNEDKNIHKKGISISKDIIIAIISFRKLILKVFVCLTTISPFF